MMREFGVDISLIRCFQSNSKTYFNFDTTMIGVEVKINIYLLKWEFSISFPIIKYKLFYSIPS